MLSSRGTRGCQRMPIRSVTWKTTAVDLEHRHLSLIDSTCHRSPEVPHLIRRDMDATRGSRVSCMSLQMSTPLCRHVLLVCRTQDALSFLSPELHPSLSLCPRSGIWQPLGPETGVYRMTGPLIRRPVPSFSPPSFALPVLQSLYVYVFSGSPTGKTGVRTNLKTMCQDMGNLCLAWVCMCVSASCSLLSPVRIPSSNPCIVC